MSNVSELINQVSQVSDNSPAIAELIDVIKVLITKIDDQQQQINAATKVMQETQHKLDSLMNYEEPTAEEVEQHKSAMRKRIRTIVYKHVGDPNDCCEFSEQAVKDFKTLLKTSANKIIKALTKQGMSYDEQLECDDNTLMTFFSIDSFRIFYPTDDPAPELSSKPFDECKTINDYKNFCKVNGITGYSKLKKKEDLIEYITSKINASADEDVKSDNASEEESPPLTKKTMKELKEFCKANNIAGFSVAKTKQALIQYIEDFQAGKIAPQEPKPKRGKREIVSAHPVLSRPYPLQVPLEAPQVPLEAPQVPLEAPQVPLEAPQVPLEAPQVPKPKSTLRKTVSAHPSTYQAPLPLPPPCSPIPESRSDSQAPASPFPSLLPPILEASQTLDITPTRAAPHFTIEDSPCSQKTITPPPRKFPVSIPSVDDIL
jgi:hypothetical protein